MQIYPLRTLILGVLISFPFTGLAQELDTLHIKKLLRVEAEMDSLRRIIKTLDHELQRVKTDVAEGADLDKLIDALNEDEEENVPEDQRSRRKRVDALLRIITDRPGQLRLNGGATTMLQTPTNSDNQTAASGSFDIFAHTSFGQGSLFFINLEAIGGNGLDEHHAAFAPLNGDAGSTQDVDGTDRLTILEAWAEFSVLNEAFTITAGKIDLTNYFDNNAAANDETAQFISGAFVNSAALPVPGNTPGLRIRTTLLNRFYLQAGIVSMDNSGADLFSDLFSMGSMGVRVFPETNWEANIRFYSYVHPEVNRPAGFGISFDESIAGLITFFARYNKNVNESAPWITLSRAFSTGVQYSRLVSRKRFFAGIALGEIKSFPTDLGGEKQAEMYARYQLSKWIHCSTHVQYVANIGGSSEDLTTMSVRTHFNF